MLWHVGLLDNLASTNESSHILILIAFKEPARIQRLQAVQGSVSGFGSRAKPAEAEKLSETRNFSGCPCKTPSGGTGIDWTFL